MLKFKNNHEKAEYVIECLTRGQEINSVAKAIGYKNAGSLDTFMRREGYLKPKGLGNYVLKTVTREDGAPTNANPSGKALSVIALYKDGQLTPKEIAYELGFDDLREMAKYMRSKGFIWDSETGNYAPQQIPKSQAPELEVSGTKMVNGAAEAHAFQDYLLLLQYLESRKEKLVEILESDTAINLPRYMVPGVFITKSVHMSNQLDRMVRDYSEERNMSQRDIFEIALVEFFKKYGYRKEVDVLLGQLS